MCVDISNLSMANVKQFIRICSFNCRSFKNSLPAIHMLCDLHDIILLQEHWLLPNELGLLSNAYSEYQYSGLSAVDISSDVLVGRPYGGTAILYRKSLANQIRILDSDESRLTGIQINTNSGLLLIGNVYMPTNYGDAASLELYCDCLAKIHAAIVDTDAVHTIIAGDFNCSPNSRFYTEFANFADENNLVMTDLNRLSDTVTYISDDGSKSSWIDHILCSYSVDTMVGSIEVINDVIISDHRPLSFTVLCGVADTGSNANETHDTDLRVPMWDKCDQDTLELYAKSLDVLLQQVNIPLWAVDSSACYLDVDKFYQDILACISNAIGLCIPSRRSVVSDYNVKR